MAINLPIRVIGYAFLQDSVKYGEELATYSHKDVHFGLTRFYSTLEIGTVSGHGSNSNDREHPDNPPHILIASMAHPGMLQPVVTGLEASWAPAKMGEELFQGGKTVDILNLSNKGCQGGDISYREIFGIVGQLLKKFGYFLLYPLDSRYQGCKPFSQDRHLDPQGWLSLEYSYSILGCFYHGFSHNLPYSASAGTSQSLGHLCFSSLGNILRTGIGYKEG